MKDLKYILFFVWIFAMGGVNAQTESLFEQGKEAYKAERYTEAIEAWKAILAQEEHSAAVYFNLGNAYYKQNEIGPSIYYYEKALQLDPADEDVKNNLAFAKNATVDAIEPLPQTFFNKWFQRLVQIADYETWAWIAVVCVLLFSVSFLIYYFAFREGRKRLWFVVSSLALLLTIISLSMAFLVKAEIRAERAAIVYAEETIVRTGPTMGSDAAFALHEGTKVSILAEEGAWLRISIADGKDGWLPASEVKEL